MNDERFVQEQDEKVRGRLKQLRQRVFKGNNAAMARACSVDPSTLHRALSGETQHISTFIKEQAIDNIEVEGQRLRRQWLEEGEEPMFVSQSDVAEPPGRRNGQSREGETMRTEVVQLDMTVGAGDGGTVVEQTPVARYTIDYVPLPELRGRRPDEPFLTRVIGNSMETEFSSGDQVVVEPYPEGRSHLIADAIYVIRVDEEFQIKQVEYKPGRRLVCKPLNPCYDPFEIDLTDESVDFEIVGRVWGKFKRY